MSVLGVKNKGEPCSHRAGMSPHWAVLNTRKGMMLKTVTLLNAAQTHWRRIMGIRLQRCVSHRCVFSARAHAPTHTHQSSLSIMQL